MRIVQLIGNQGRSGAGRAAYYLGEGLRHAGYDVTYAANPKFLAEFFGDAPEDDWHWPVHGFRRISLREVLRFNRRAASADIVITHDSKSRHVALVAKCLGLKPRLWFVRHCASGTTRFGATQLYRLLVDQQIAVSDFVQQTLLSSGFPRERVARIYAAVDLKPFLKPDMATVAQLRKKFLNDLAPGTLTIGILARMAVTKKWRLEGQNQKGYDLLFKALAVAGIRYRVLILGPSTPEACEALRQMAVFHGANPEHLRFPGFASNVADYFRLMDVNVLPAINEGLGLALVEGMASAVASVGANSGGIPEIIRHEDNGLLFEPGNAAELAACLQRLAKDPQYRDHLGQRGRETVLSRFNASRMTQMFCDLLARKGYPRTERNASLSKSDGQPVPARVQP